MAWQLTFQIDTKSYQTYFSALPSPAIFYAHACHPRGKIRLACETSILYGHMVLGSTTGFLGPVDYWQSGPRFPVELTHTLYCCLLCHMQMMTITIVIARTSTTAPTTPSTTDSSNESSNESSVEMRGGRRG